MDFSFLSVWVIDAATKAHVLEALDYQCPAAMLYSTNHGHKAPAVHSVWKTNRYWLGFHQQNKGYINSHKFYKLL